MHRLITSKSLANWLPTASRRLLASSSSTSTPSGAPSAAPSASTPLIVTERAFKRLQTITQPGEVLRIVVEGGGCSGFEYKLDLDNKVNDDDEVVENEGQKVVVDKMSLEFIRGSTIDYTQEMMRSAFRITDNPLADKGCSCGSSFSVKLEMISRLAPSIRQISQTAVRSHAFSSRSAPLAFYRSENGHRSNNQNNGQQRQRSRRFGNGPKVAAPLLGFSIMVSLKDFFGIDKVQLDADPLKDKIKQSWLARKYGKYDEAVEILHNALPEATEHSDPLVLTRIVDELANTYFEKGDLENAEKCFRDVIQRLVRLHGKNDASPEFIGISLKMADIFAHKGDLDNAETGFRHCVSKQLQIMENHVKKYVLAKGAALEERHLVEAHGPAYSDPIALFGMCLEVFAHFLIEFRGDDRLQEAEEYIDEVLKITSHLYGTSSFRLMTVLNNFGAICVRKGRFDLAKKYLAIGVDRIMHIDECSTLIVGYYCNYAEALFHTGGVEEALEYAKKATILAKDEGPAVLKYSQNFLKALENDARAQGKTGGRWYSWWF